MEQYTTITVLHAKGHGIRAIARDLGLSRNTVKKYIRSQKEPEYGSDRPQRLPVLLRPSRSNWQECEQRVLDMWLVKKFSGSRILRELQTEGFRGSKSAFFEWFAALRRQHGFSKAKMRYETPPGEQAQFDWAEYLVEIGGQKRKVYVFQTILSFSRMKVAIGSFDTRLPSLFFVLEATFRRFGGTPMTFLVDNARQMVLDADRRVFAWNPRFLLFMNHFGMAPKACKVRHPWTKGKVENGFKYIENHFIKGNTFRDLDDFNARLANFIADWNDRVHSGVQEKPSDRFELERGHLNWLPRNPFTDSVPENRKVSKDCLVSVGGNRYSVPWTHAGAQVWVRTVLGQRLEILSQKQELLATHTLVSGTGQILIQKEHYKGLNPENREQTAWAAFQQRFSGHDGFVEALKKQGRATWRTQLAAILTMADIYGFDAVNTALSVAFERGIISSDFIMLYLGSHASVPAPATTVSALLSQPTDPELVRNLAVYGSIGGSDGA